MLSQNQIFEAAYKAWTDSLTLVPFGEWLLRQQLEIGFYWGISYDE